jgi:hypothetical protein
VDIPGGEQLDIWVCVLREVRWQLVVRVFKIEISDKDAEKLTTVGETQTYLLNKGIL